MGFLWVEIPPLHAIIASVRILAVAMRYHEAVQGFIEGQRALRLLIGGSARSGAANTGVPCPSKEKGLERDRMRTYLGIVCRSDNDVTAPHSMSH